MFGITPTTVWDMEASQFFALIPAMEQYAKQQRQRESGPN
jgi:hypothetical protein